MKPIIIVLSIVFVIYGQGQNKQPLQDVTLENLKIGILGKEDVPTENNLENTVPFAKLSKLLEADHTKRIYASVNLKDKASGKPFRAHQVFAIFTHEAGHESIFVFDSQGSGKYALDINLAKGYKDFDGLSGKYSVRFVSGDSLMKNPINYVFADIKLTIPTMSHPNVPKSQQVVYEHLQEIAHIFRQPDKRPPAFVSLVFTLVCLSPLVLLVLLWGRIGLNFGNMPSSIFVVMFHASLAAIFALYFIFWLQLDMFQTLKYLAVVGAVAFFSGNRVLRTLSNQRKQKAE